MVSVAKMMTNNYWRNREREERKWQLQQLKQDGQFNKELERYYNQAVNNINKEIDAEFSRLAYQNKSTLEAARKAVSQADIHAYEMEAQQLVEEARLRRAAGHKVTYADYSDEVNERMRIYNATMRINRLELLKSRIGLQMINAGIKVDESIQDKVAKDYMAEAKRQAGILGVVTESDQFWTSKEIAKQIKAQIKGATFSQRIWANQDALKAKLDVVISTGIMRGDNPREMAGYLKDQVHDTVKNHRYVTERIVRTESARVQFNAQKALIKKNGYRYVKWYAEPGACKICREIADSDRYDLGFGVYPVDEVPSIPAHPNCRCSISEYWVDGRKDNWMNPEADNEMFHRSTHQLPGNDYVPTDRMNQILKSFIRRGGIVLMGEDVDKRLRQKQSSASILDKDTILVSSWATEMAIREEAFHANQLMRKEQEDDGSLNIRMEIEAQYALLKYAKKHHMDYNEIAELERNLKWWQNKLKQFERGEI